MKDQQTVQFALTSSRHFPEWLAEQRCSLIFTTYQSGKIFMLGLKPDGRLSVFERTMDRVMGLAVRGNDIYTSTLWQLWRFSNALLPAQRYQHYDRVFLPRQSWVTGDIDIHDMAVEDSGRLVFVNTLFNCLATVDDGYSFRPLWKPSWIGKLAPEDRCHLNGLALRDGQARYMTSVSRSDVNDGWRDKRRDSGVAVDITTGEVVCEGMAMPHSPRWHDGNLFVLNSGAGYFGRVDFQKRAFEPIAFMPGYARGMAIHGNWAVAGLSDRRKNRTFQDLPLEDALKKHEAETRCGLQVIDLKTGDVPHWVRIEGTVSELYDVAIVPDCVCPMLIGFVSDEIKRMVSHPEL